MAGRMTKWNRTCYGNDEKGFTKRLTKRVTKKMVNIVMKWKRKDWNK